MCFNNEGEEAFTSTLNAVEENNNSKKYKMDCEYLAHLQCMATTYCAFIFQTNEQKIVWNCCLIIDDSSKLECIANFCFRKYHWKFIASWLWPRLVPFLNGEQDCIRLKNRDLSPYETGLLVLLFRLSW